MTDLLHRLRAGLWEEAFRLNQTRNHLLPSEAASAAATRNGLMLCVLLSSGLYQVSAQYVPPPSPALFKGFINEWLPRDDPFLSKWDLGGAIRLRYEVKEGFAISGVPGSVDFRDHGADVDNEYLLSRIRFHAAFAEDWWSVMAEGQSSLAAGDERWAYANNPKVAGTVARQGEGPESDSIDLHQAFVTLGNKEFPLSLKVGRQELSYGEERLVGAVNWNNIGRVFDAAKARWQTEWFGADFFASRVVIPEDGRFDVANNYDWFSGVYATITKIPKNTWELYFLSRNASTQASAAEPSPQFPQPSARDIYTLGTRLKSLPGQLGPWDYKLETAGQLGDFRDPRLGPNSARLDHQAYMVSAQAGYTFASVAAKPRLGLEYDFASGDSNPGDGKHETFENLFPTNHKFYGYMDFVSLQNIHDLRGIFQLQPHPRLSLAIEGHGFWLADTHDNFYTASGTPRGGISTTPGNNYGINPSYSNFVGTELDVIAGYALTRFAQLEAGYGHFFTGDYIRSSLSAASVGSRDADYLYFQANVTF
jgi:hypothetical protein